MPHIRVLSPVGEVKRHVLTAPPLPSDLKGKTIGFLDNTKTNFDRLVADMSGLLRERFGVKAVVHRKKANAATPAAREILEELAKACDLVFAGSAD
ncbi:MAG: hypothetical protein HYV92_02580 [Candidatus Rokubacteria bacterium]|nr:hypothetical protein [Candidatus Rokubacteria bacterium]MBI2553314.1 hypothetical protein [Candidatus Rokubacteria bacterium]